MDLSNTEIPERIVARRIKLSMSKVDLAEKAGVSVKVVHQIETRARERFLEKTILLIAAALDTTIAELARPARGASKSLPDRAPEPEPSPEPECLSIPAPTPPPQPAEDQPLEPSPRMAMRARPRVLLAVAAALLLLVAVPTFIAASRLTPPRVIAVEGRTVVVSESTTGKQRWSRGFSASIVFAEPSPWRDGTVLVGLDFDAPDGGRLLLLDGRTGGTIWQRQPDAGLAARAFGADSLAGLAGFLPMLWRGVDLRGDGRLQAAVSFIHTRNYPGSVMIIERDGTVVGEYMNRGHVYAMLAADIDGDGRQELVCGGASNDEQFSGGVVFILDLEHCRGAAVDPHTGGNPDVPDGARRRVLLPSFGEDILGWLGAARTSVDHLLAPANLDGNATIVARVGHDRCVMHVMFDQDLNPLGALPTDSVRLAVAGWPVDDPAHFGPNCAEWRARWLQASVTLASATTAAGASKASLP